VRQTQEEDHRAILTRLCSLQQETGAATMEVNFCGRTEHVPITPTWEDFLDKRDLSHLKHRFFFDLATGRPLTRGATLEAVGYRGGKLAVGIWYVMGESMLVDGYSPPGVCVGPATGTPPAACEF
jgi:hypothetical protein